MRFKNGIFNNVSSEKKENLEIGTYEYSSGGYLSRLSILENNEVELLFWRNNGNSPSDEDFFFQWQDGVWEYKVTGGRSYEEFLLEFTPTDKGVNVRVTCINGDYGSVNYFV